jgi:hypothetical protein
MPKEILQYNLMVEAALRAVVRQSLAEVAEAGLPGNHHFYITFRTAYPGVRLPDYLRARYPAEMTIVLQFQFYDLVVDDVSFAVTLTFNNAPERLVIPLRAITVFADPSVNFALPFQPPEAPPEAEPEPEPPHQTALESVGKASEDGEKGGEVVSLDKFRKK